MGLFFYTQKGSIIPKVDLPTTEIIEPEKQADEFFELTKDNPSVIHPIFQIASKTFLKDNNKIINALEYPIFKCKTGSNQ
ncbi:hypothetical protein SORDD17_01320 [Streptococcus oralis]|uniref:Uncharacterized protein n=1 Tax=Streptococcus oralis TaxID=1303 RepID=A0A139RIX3_STROR|nr:hypothetical protein SORDD17_01320 [Streptococcus oralis]